MLSRLAEALFWIGRYVERAAHTARLVDVTYYRLLEGGPQADHLRWEPLLIIVGERERFFSLHPDATPQAVFEYLGFRADNPNAIVQCIAQARENARTIRDRISREMWEDLNGLYLETGAVRPDTVIAAGPHQFCSLVKVGSHRFHGVTDATLPHDEGWYFLRAGQALERADMTARTVNVQYHGLVEDGVGDGEADNHEWMAVLKSMAAYEYYRRRYNSRIDPEKVAELLILNGVHPQAIRFNVAALHACLRAISGSTADAYANEAERLTGRLHDRLKYDRLEDIFARGLSPFLTDVQETCRVIGDQMARSYFYHAVAS